MAPQSGGCGRRAAIVPRRDGASVPQTKHKPINQQQTKRNHHQQQPTTKNNLTSKPRGAVVTESCSVAAACEKWVPPNKVAPARDVHAMPDNGVGGGAYIPRLLQLWVPGTPAGAEAIPKRRTASPPGARRKGSRALLPLAT